MADSSNRPGVERVGEIIETSTVSVWAESDRLNELPALGVLVQVSGPSDERIFAVVSFGQTTGIDSTRRAVRRGSEHLQDADVYRRHPELSRILRTTFEAVPIAFERAGTLARGVPPLPPPLHYSVLSVDQRDLRAVTDDLRYLPLLTRYQGPVSPEQLIAAHIRCVFEARQRDELWLELAAGEVARLYKRDYERLVPILEAIEPGN